MASLGSFSVEVLANIARFESDLGKAQQLADRRARDLQRTFTNAGRAIGGALAAVGVGLSAQAVASWVGNAIKAADAANDLATRIGVSAESISRLSVAAKLSDTNLGALQNAFAKLAKTQLEAAAGGQEQLALFRAMGVEFKNVDGTLRNSEDVLRDVADVFKNLGEGPERTALALKVFGRAGAELIPFLSGGSAELDRFAKLSDSLGITISTKTAKAAAEFSDRMDLLQLAVQGLGAQVSEKLLGHLLSLTQRFSEIVADGSAATTIADGIATAVEGAGTAFEFATGLAADFVEKLEAIASIGATVGEKLDGMGVRLGTVLPAFGASEFLARGYLRARADAQPILPRPPEDLSRLGGGLDPTRRMRDLTGALTDAQRKTIADDAAAVKAKADALEKARNGLIDYLKATNEAAAADAKHREAMRLAERAARDLAKAQQDVDAALMEQRAALSPLHKVMAEYEAALADAAQRAEELAAAGIKEAEVDEFLAAKIATLTQKRDADVAAVKRQLAEQERQSRVVENIEASYRDQIRLLGMTEQGRRVEEELLRRVAAAQEYLIQLTDEERAAKVAAMRAAIEKGEADVEAAEKAAQAAEQAMRDLQGIVDNAANGIGDAITSALFDGAEAGAEKMKDVMENLARDLVRFWLQQKIIVPLQQQLTGGGGSGGLLGTLGGGGLGGILGSAALGFGIGGGSGAIGGLLGRGFASTGIGANLIGSGLSALGVSGAALGSLVPVVGTIIGSVLGRALGNLLGGGDPRFRVADRENDFRTSSRLDDVIGVARDNMESGSATALGNSIRDFDNAIAEFLQGDNLERVRAALANFTLDVKGDAATIENVLTQRFGAILATFDSDTQAFVNAADTLEERVQRLAEALARPGQIQAILDALGEESMLAQMSEAERALYQLNRQFDAVRDQVEQLGATEAQLAEVEAFRQEAIDRLTSGQQANTAAVEASAQALHDAAQTYAEFVRQFDVTGSPFQQSLQTLLEQFEDNTRQANELARAAGLQAARVEDLAAIERSYMREREAAIQSLMASVITQAGELGYIVTATALEAQIAAINDQIGGLGGLRSEGTFGLVIAMQREQQLNEQRAALEQQLEGQRRAEEMLRRQTGALGLAQNLADLSLARGVGFDQLASELGLNLDLFGADLGLTAEGLRDLISTLEAESLTADAYADGVADIVAAIERANGAADGSDIGRPDPLTLEGGKGLYASTALIETIELLREEVRTLRQQFAAQGREELEYAAASLSEQQDTNRSLRGVTLDRGLNAPRTERLKSR